MFTDIIKGAQRGLLVPAVFGQVATLHRHNHDRETGLAILALVRRLAREAQASGAGGLVAAFSPALWGHWHDRRIPVRREVLNGSPKLRDTGGDVTWPRVCGGWRCALPHDCAAVCRRIEHHRRAVCDQETGVRSGQCHHHAA